MKHLTDKPSFLLINPPIYDFAAFDLWSKPLGLLYISSILKSAGADVRLLDCLDRQHPACREQRSDIYGRGKYLSMEVEKPIELKGITRKYKRYGMGQSEFAIELAGSVKPDMVLVTSSMTYWYPGVQEVIAKVKEGFPRVPVVLGGIYATLCPEHAAKTSGADHIVSGWGLSGLERIIENETGVKIGIPRSFADFPKPDHESYSNHNSYAVLKTGVGCPFNCCYCASLALSGGVIERKGAEKVIAEIQDIHRQGIRNIALYDDALLASHEKYIEPILEEITHRNINMYFHTPNGLHARFITPKVAKLLNSSGFVIPRLSLETTNIQRQSQSGAKVTNIEFEEATINLRRAGYKQGSYMAYVMLGLPGQTMSEVEDSIRFAHGCGAKVSVSEYSPIPGTKDWENVKQRLPSSDPLWHNNSVYPTLSGSERPAALRLKILAKELNNCFT